MKYHRDPTFRLWLFWRRLWVLWRHIERDVLAGIAVLLPVAVLLLTLVCVIAYKGG